MAMMARIPRAIATISQSACAGVGDAGDDHPADGRRDDRQQSEPQERSRVECDELAAERREVETGAAAQWRDPVGDHQHDADDQQGHGDSTSSR